MPQTAGRRHLALIGRRCLGLLVGAALLGAAARCEISHVDPNAQVHISGRALDATGAPLAATTVRLFKQADLGEVVEGVVLALGSVGTVCLLPEAPAICARAHVTTAGADGSYHFDLKGSDTRGLFGTVSTLVVVVAARTGGARAPNSTMAFAVRSTTVALPDLRLWDAGLRVTEGGGKIRLGWSPLASPYGRAGGYTAQFGDPAQPAALWAQPASGTGTEVDARVLEDVQSSVAAQAGASLSGVNETFRVTYMSSSLDVPPVAGPPPSRHRPCFSVSGSNLTTAPQADCRATDGDLIAPARLTAPIGQLATGAVIDLGAVHPIGLVVARGLAATFVVEVSPDAVTYTQVGMGTGSPVAIVTPAGTGGRFIRVRSPSGLDESRLSEISIW